MRTTSVTRILTIVVLVSALGLFAGCNKQAAAPSDQQITSGVQARLQSESALAGQNIQVAVSHGIVTLSGTAADPASRALAGNDAGSVAGVKTVVNNLEVQPPPAAASIEQAPAHEAAAAPKPQPKPHEQRVRERRAQSPVEPRARHRTIAKTATIPPPPPPDTTASAVPSAAPALPPPPPPPPQPVKKVIVLKAGTVIPVRLTGPVDSKTAQVGDTFHATLASDVMRDGVVAIPQGTVVLGRVVDAKDATHFRGKALLSLELTRIDLNSGRIALVSSTFTKEGEARGKNTAEKTGGGALLGALVGALAGGGRGAAIGAMAGAGAGAGVNAVTRGKQVVLPSETLINFSLQQPLSFTKMIMPGESNPPSNQPALEKRPNGQY